MALPARGGGELRLNEVVALNQTGLVDDRGGRPDWVELHNPGAVPVDLAGWSLSDDPGRPRKWTFGSGTLPPGGFLVVFASGEDRQPVVVEARDPSTLPGRVLHLSAAGVDPTDPGQVRVSASGRFVRRWRDGSDRRQDAQQGVERRQPQWVGGPEAAVRFDGVDDLLELGSPPGTNGFSLLMVARPFVGHEWDEVGTSGVGGTSGQRWLWGAAHGGDRGAGVGVSAGTNGVAVYEHGSGYMPARAALTHGSTGEALVISVVYRDRRPTLGLSGAVLPEAPGSPRDPVVAPTELGSGAYGAFAGEVLEVVAFDRALEATEWQGVERFLAERHGLRLESPYHTNFRIDAGGERLLLTRPDGSRADDWVVPALPRDVAFGRSGGGGDALGFLADPTPGRSNPVEVATRFLAAPFFTVAPGFYEAPVQVGLQLPPGRDGDGVGVEIRYTLDGSEPGATAALYTGAFLVTNRTARANTWSAIPTAPGWQAPSGLVFKGTVIRARALARGAIPSDVTTGTYFVDPRGRGRYPVPVVSLATAPGNFFDPDRGIYVVGNSPGGNYAQSGDAWERPVHVEFFETNGVRVLAQEAGVRVHGNTSFGFPLKALRLHARNQRGTGPFRYRVFPDLEVERFERLLLRPSGHDHHLTMMRDGLQQGLVRELGLDLQGYRPAVVFVDGEYWGIHNLQEALEKQYFASHHPGVDADAVDYLEGYSPGAHADEGDTLAFEALMGLLRSGPLTRVGVLNEVGARMELANYRDYKLAEMFHYRWDIGNHRLWRPRIPGGRFRWILFDCDVGFGGFWSEPQPWAFDMLEAVLTPSGSLHGHNSEATVFLLGTLLGDPGFRDDFVDRAADLLNSTLSSSRVLGFIERMAAEIEPLMGEHTARWRAPASITEWRRNVDALRTFARLRPGFVRTHLQRRFGLGETVALTLAVAEGGEGVVRCNSLAAVAGGGGDSTWTGLYFRGRPVRVEAVARPGWRFAGWAEIPGETRAAILLNPTVALRLTARFAPGPGLVPRLTWSNGGVGASGAGVWAQTLPGARLVLEASEDLRTWSVESAGAVADSQGSTRIPVVQTTGAARFYRVRLENP